MQPSLFLEILLRISKKLFFGKVAAAGALLAATASYFYGIEPAVTAFGVVATLRYVAFNRIISVHNTLL